MASVQPDPRDLAQHLTYCRGAAIELIARAGDTTDAIEALTAAKAMLDREIALLEAERAWMRVELEQDLAAPPFALRSFTVHGPDGTSHPAGRLH